MSVKINTLEMENVKKIRAVQLTPTENGLICGEGISEDDDEQDV